MPKNKNSVPSNAKETDSRYIIKLIFFLVLGSLWVRLVFASFVLPVPIGFFIGLLIVRSDRFQLDRKIEYAFLIMAMFVGFWLPVGIEILL